MLYELIVIGVSSGGFQALKEMLPLLPSNFPVPIAIVQHISEQSGTYASEHLDKICQLTVKEAEDKEPIHEGYVYMAPAGYHMLIEPDKSISLSVDEKVNFSCPSIDVLFESASEAYGAHIIGIVLTGSNHDGALGIRKIKQGGGLTIAQNPADANSPTMPLAAMAATEIDHTVTISELAPLLIRLTKEKS